MVPDIFNRNIANAKTKGIAALVELFDKLAGSTKVDNADKPACYALLAREAVSQASLVEIKSVLSAVGKHQALNHLDDRQDVASHLVGKAFKAALARSVVAGTDRPLIEAMVALLDAGVARDRGEVLGLGVIAGLQVRTLDRIADATY